MRQEIVARLQKTRTTREARNILQGYRRDILDAIDESNVETVKENLGVDPIRELFEINVALGDAGLIAETDGAQ